MPRFVVLEHDHPFLHWDLMLEQGQALRTWRLLRPPDTGGPIPAQPLPDHRLEYLDYEGPVSRGRGTVRRWDRGEYTTATDNTDLVEGQLSGEKLQGRFALEPAELEGQWSFRLASD